MIEYFFIYIFVISSSIGYVYFPRLKSIFIFQVVFIFFIFAGFRGSVGADTVVYESIYNRYLVEGYGVFDFRFEPIFVFIMKVCSYFSNDAQILFVFYAATQSFFLFFVLKNMKSPMFFLCIYTIAFYLQFHMNVIRVGLAAIVFIYSLQCSSKKKSILFLSLSLLCHFSILLVVPLWLIYRKMVNLKVIATAFLFLILLIYILYDYILIKNAMYFDGGEKIISLSPIALMIFMSAPTYYILSVFIRKRFSPVLLFTVTFLSAMILGMLYIDIFYRIYTLICFFILFFVSQNGVNIKCQYNVMAPFYILFFSSLVLFSTLAINNERQYVEKSRGKSSIEYQYTFIPYVFSFNE